MRGIFVTCIILIAAGSCVAQDFVAPRQPRREITAPQKPITPLDPDSNIEGAVAAVFQMKQPWQLVNPLAAKGYGDGRYLTSWDERNPEKPKGFIIFGFRVW